MLLMWKMEQEDGKSISTKGQELEEKCQTLQMVMFEVQASNGNIDWDLNLPSSEE